MRNLIWGTHERRHSRSRASKQLATLSERSRGARGTTHTNILKLPSRPTSFSPRYTLHELESRSYLSRPSHPSSLLSHSRTRHTVHGRHCERILSLICTLNEPHEPPRHYAPRRHTVSAHSPVSAHDPRSAKWGLEQEYAQVAPAERGASLEW